VEAGIAPATGLAYKSTSQPLLNPTSSNFPNPVRFTMHGNRSDVCLRSIEASKTAVCWVRNIDSGRPRREEALLVQMGSNALTVSGRDEPRRLTQL
jgi:hypothetical protein